MLEACVENNLERAPVPGGGEGTVYARSNTWVSRTSGGPARGGRVAAEPAAAILEPERIQSALAMCTTCTRTAP